jgi:hypothetical protein
VIGGLIGLALSAVGCRAVFFGFLHEANWLLPGLSDLRN